MSVLTKKSSAAEIAEAILNAHNKAALMAGKLAINSIKYDDTRAAIEAAYYQGQAESLGDLYWCISGDAENEGSAEPSFGMRRMVE